jgi:hypothetical protein
VIGSGSGFTPNGCTAGTISKVYILQADGTSMPGWPFDLGTAAPPNPALADVDVDGNVEIIVSYSQSVYVWDAPGALNPARTPWPYYHLGIDHTGWYGQVNPAAAEEIASLSAKDRWSVWPNPAVAGRPIRIAGNGPVTVSDVGGRLIQSLVGGEWDGRDTFGRPVPAGIYYVGGASGQAKLVISR